MTELYAGRTYSWISSVLDYFQLNKGYQTVLKENGMKRLPRTLRHPIAARYEGNGCEAAVRYEEIWSSGAYYPAVLAEWKARTPEANQQAENLSQKMWDFTNNYSLRNH